MAPVATGAIFITRYSYERCCRYLDRVTTDGLQQSDLESTDSLRAQQP